ncbi:MAG TPA: dienelactone hydrolase family protein [Labilithrix sp.]
MTTQVTFKSKSGQTAKGELAEPAANSGGKHGAIVLVQEWWGVDDHIKSLVDRMAKEGFLVVAPDLYHGVVVPRSKPDEAMKHMQALDTLKAVDEIAGAVAFLKEHAHANGKVGVMGFCLGGGLTLASACHIPGLSGAVAFYGTPPDEKVDWTKTTAPIMMHIAQKDEWVTVARGEDVKKKVEAAGKTKVELHTYDANHAFVNDQRPDAYSPENAKLAWERTVAFFKKHLA